MRCEHDGVMTGANGEVSFINVKTLNEWDSRVRQKESWIIESGRFRDTGDIIVFFTALQRSGLETETGFPERSGSGHRAEEQQL